MQPDRVVLIFGVETFARTPRASQAQNARLSKEVLDAIRAHSIAERDIATAHFTIQPRYDDYDWNVISGYEARNTIAVTLRNVQKLEPVLVAALEAGATAVDGIEFSVTNLRELRDEARELAIQAALEKAAAMSAAAGVALGDVTNIREDGLRSSYFGSWRGDRQWTQRPERGARPGRRGRAHARRRQHQPGPDRRDGAGQPHRRTRTNRKTRRVLKTRRVSWRDCDAP